MRPFRSPTIITIVAIGVVVLVILLATRPDILASNLLTWREKRAYMPTYQAPLHLCDQEDRIPNSYCIFLHVGYPLEQHRQAVGNGTNLDANIEHIYPETDRHGLYYSAEMDDASLDVVRADLGVDMVECNTRVWLIDSVYEEDAGLVYDLADYSIYDDEGHLLDEYNADLFDEDEDDLLDKDDDGTVYNADL